MLVEGRHRTGAKGVSERDAARKAKVCDTDLAGNVVKARKIFLLTTPIGKFNPILAINLFRILPERHVGEINEPPRCRVRPDSKN